MELGEVIKFLRKDSKMTQDELAAALGVKKSAVQKYESGAIRHLKIGTVRDLCVVFNCVPFVFIFPERVDKLYLSFRSRYELTADSSFGLTPQYEWIVNIFHGLNDDGMNRWRDYGEELVLIEKYKIKD